MNRLRIRTADQSEAGRRTRLLLWLFAAFVVALTWVAPFQRLEVERRDMITGAVRENEHRAMMLEQYVTRTLEAADIATLHIAERYRRDDSRLRRGSAAQPALISGPIAGRRAFLGLSIANADGDLVASTLGAAVAGSNVRGHEAFQAHVGRRGGGLHISRPAPSRVFGRTIIWLSRRLENDDGSFAGVVAINIEPGELIGALEGVQTRASDVSAVIGLDGIVRARRGDGRLSAGEDLNGTRAMAMQRARPAGTYVGPSTVDGLTRYYSHRRLADYPLFATYGVLERDVLASIEQRRRLIILVALVVTVVTLTFAFVISTLLGRRDRWAATVAESHRRLEDAQRVARIGDWEYDLDSGAIRWSQPMFEMYRRDPAAGPPTLDEYRAMLDPESAHIVEDAIQHAVATGAPRSYEVRVTLPGGGESHRLVSVQPVRGPDGSVTSLHGTDQDVSARNKLDRLEAEVSHLSRLTAMNAMAATLAHELNQPLAAASNYLVGSRRLLKAQGGGSAQLAEGLAAAQHQVQFAGEIIRRVRAMVANDPRQPATAAVARIIDDAIFLAETGGGAAGVPIERDLAGDARFVRADRVQIQQVLLNLIRNALDEVATVAAPRIRISSRRGEDNEVVIAVEDNGTGFREASSQLFTAFASDKPDGLGLGLSISRTIVEAHGGRMRAENLAGGGARVSFTLPAAAAAEASR